MFSSHILVIIFYILLFDSVGANILSWTRLRRWYTRACAPVARFFPLSRGWTTYYLILVLLIGYIIDVFVSPLW